MSLMMKRGSENDLPINLIAKFEFHSGRIRITRNGCLNRSEKIQQSPVIYTGCIYPVRIRGRVHS